ncbi:MAG: hypothetical protein RIQ85_1139, partial [Pseudomonadota bacterium]
QKTAHKKEGFTEEPWQMMIAVNFNK